MWWRNDPEVLVVGAGPVGLAVAGRLVRNGIRTRILDKQRAPAGRSYALALHSQTLRSLAQLGLEEAVRGRAHGLNGLSFLQDDERVAEVDWSDSGEPALLVVPQQALEEILGEDLEHHGVEIEWNRRVARVTPDADGPPLVTVERLVKDSMGYPIAGTGWVVHSTRKMRPRYVVGADGVTSVVRRDMHVELESAGDIETYAVFETTGPAGTWDHAIVALHGETKNVLWPMGDGRLRWSFEIQPPDPALLPRVKERTQLPHRGSDPRASEDSFRDLLRERAGWFFGDVEGVSWSAVASFERYVTPRFGEGSLWLAGDAAHGASPLGVQGMNVGIQEGVLLADALTRAIQEEAPEALEDWEAERRRIWRRLLGLEGGAEATDRAGSWVRGRERLIPQWLPASGTALDELLGQLGLAWPASTRSPVSA